jgi:hypothetical protein
MMKTLSRWMLVVVALVAMSVRVAPAIAGGGLLDGRTFEGEVGEIDESGDHENFVFAEGEFDPIACHEWGFYATPYSATEEQDGVIRFAAEHTNDDGNRMRWEGVVEGDSLSGSMWYWEGDDPPVEYWFRGHRAAGSDDGA